MPNVVLKCLPVPRFTMLWRRRDTQEGMGSRWRAYDGTLWRFIQHEFILVIIILSQKQYQGARNLLFHTLLQLMIHSTLSKLSSFRCSEAPWKWLRFERQMPLRGVSVLTGRVKKFSYPRPLNSVSSNSSCLYQGLAFDTRSSAVQAHFVGHVQASAEREIEEN